MSYYYVFPCIHRTLHQFHRYGITFRAISPCLFGCNFIFYPQNHKNKILLNGILPDHYTLRISTELAYGKYLFLVLKVVLRNHINFDAYFEPLSNNYKTISHAIMKEKSIFYGILNILGKYLPSLFSNTYLCSVTESHHFCYGITRLNSEKLIDNVTMDFI